MSESRPKVIVTGASSGIGKATAVRFAQEGWDVCLQARRENVLQQVRASLAPGQHLICTGPYNEQATSKRLRTMLQAEWGHVDALVNCAGVHMTADAINSPWDKWRKPFDIMVNGAINMSRVAVPLMPDGGRIIHISSIHGERVENGSSAYAMAKAAINQHCRALALELAPRHILVNAIAPGFVDTPMSVSEGVNELHSDWFRQNYIDGYHLPLRRAAQPEEIAGVAYFLAGRDASY
ncbi:MAG: SDR family oxidoreductase, partial [Ktedonobacteraceae bacterium]|nr:SDR family oxidoreductase [Ktedonobacteraceae bacterium]